LTLFSLVWAYGATRRNKNWKGGFYEGEKQRTQGKQEGAPVEPKREEKVEEGEEERPLGTHLENHSASGVRLDD
jgi:hypothetical protein